MCAPPAVPWQCLGVRLQQRTAPFERAQRSVLHVGAVHPCQLSASGAWDGLPLALARGSKLGEGHRKTCTGPALRIRSKSAYVCRVSLNSINSQRKLPNHTRAQRWRRMVRFAPCLPRGVRRAARAVASYQATKLPWSEGCAALHEPMSPEH